TAGSLYESLGFETAVVAIQDSGGKAHQRSLQPARLADWHVPRFTMRTMKPTSGTTTSVWMATADPPSEKALNQNTSTNVVIVGAGIAGLTTAYLLARAGKAVIVLDDGPIGGGMTARTTAHLTCALDDRFYELERLFGEEGSRLAAQSHTSAIDRVEQIIRQESIDCEFERLDGYLFIPPNGKMKVLD